MKLAVLFYCFYWLKRRGRQFQFFSRPNLDGFTILASFTHETTASFIFEPKKQKTKQPVSSSFTWNCAFSEFYAKTAVIFGPVSLKLGQLFWVSWRFLKLVWNCYQFHLSFKSDVPFQNSKKVVRNFCQKNFFLNKKRSSFKKGDLCLIFMPNLQFWQKKIGFETGEKVWNQFNQNPPRYVLFFSLQVADEFLEGTTD